MGSRISCHLDIGRPFCLYCSVMDVLLDLVGVVSRGSVVRVVAHYISTITIIRSIHTSTKPRSSTFGTVFGIAAEGSSIMEAQVSHHQPGSRAPIVDSEI